MIHLKRKAKLLIVLMLWKMHNGVVTGIKPVENVFSKFPIIISMINFMPLSFYIGNEGTY